jgi:aldose 1-epimerase
MLSKMTEPTKTLLLQSGDSQLTLCPEIGASIARFSWKGHDIFRRAPDTAISERNVRLMGVFPLVPYSNRIGQAKLIVGMETFTLRPNFIQGAHSIHGFGWQRQWQVVKQTAATAELTFKHSPDADWPFACESKQIVKLDQNVLTMVLSVTNNDKRPMPAGLGFHPFFPISADTHLQSDWKGMWKMDGDSLPTTLGPVPPEADFSQLRPVSNWKVDNCFTGWSRRAVLDYSNYRMQIEASEACRQIVVFAPNDGRNFIALEPVTNINNAFALAAKGVVDTGMRMLGTSESLEISMSITLSGRAATPKPNA